MFEQFIKDVKAWATQDIHIECMLLVGSYARDTQKDSSDIDLCILTTNKNQMVETKNFLATLSSDEFKKGQKNTLRPIMG